jgi:hypothetical protein
MLKSGCRGQYLDLKCRELLEGGRLHNESFHNLHSIKRYQIGEVEVRGACSALGRNDKHIQNLTTRKRDPLEKRNRYEFDIKTGSKIMEGKFMWIY